MTIPEGQPKKYIMEGGVLTLNPAYREWKNGLNSAPMVHAEATPLSETYYSEEEGAEPPVAVAESSTADYGVGSTEILDGKHVVPKGVAVEMIKNFNGRKDLLNDCPRDVRMLLESKGAFDLYEKFVQTIYDDKESTNALGRWRDAQFVTKVDLFRDDFAEKGIKIALCARYSGSGNKRWLEYIDVAESGNYVPQYDLSNMSGQTIRTCYTRMTFPKGVAVEELKQWGGRKKLEEKMPYEVEKLLKKHDLLGEYENLVDDFVKACGGKTGFKNWNIEHLKALVDKYDIIFGTKGIDVYVSHKQEWISHGKAGGHYEYYRWIEFVDRNQQPNYVPQRDADENDEKGCSIM